MSRRLLDKLQAKFGRFALPNLTLFLILGQVVIYILALQKPELRQAVALVPELVLQGQWWRVLTFLFTPPFGAVSPAGSLDTVLAFFFWYLFYLMGATLEAQWGTFRYNVYVLVGYVATVGVAFINPEVQATNGFLFGTIFLAFAFLYPDFVLYIFFILPVKIRWLALLTWIGYGWALLSGDWSTKLAVLASTGNFLLFFHAEIRQRISSGHRRMAAQARSLPSRDEPFHRCRICGITDKSHPGTEFRYCSKCAGTCGYCPEHLRNHEHVVANDSPKD
jgi:hypothetical protein